MLDGSSRNALYQWSLSGPACESWKIMMRAQLINRHTERLHKQTDLTFHGFYVQTRDKTEFENVFSKVSCTHYSIKDGW